MKRRMRANEDLARAAGLWLRCFLGFVIGMLCAGGATSLCSQVDVPGPERLSHVDGYVVNPVGRPVADVEVTLVRDDRIAYQTKTDKSGEFRFDHVRGQYTFRVARTEYAPAIQEIVVTDEVVTALERKKLYVILGPGACKDACSSVMTSKRDFDRAIRERTKH
ncbi:MAG: carboxypeptidase-like regulatory domain-containing protein [Terracidiphilus sp.]